MKIERIPVSWRMPAGYALLLALLALGTVAVAATNANVPVFFAVRDAAMVVPAVVYATTWESLTLAGDSLSAFALAAVLLTRRPDLAWAGIVAAAPASLYTHGLKALFPVPRPPAVLLDPALAVLGPVLKQGSFPSGHSVTAGVLAGLVVLGFRKPAWSAAALLVALLIALSRVVVGVHWPLDVVAGLFGGLLSAWIGVCLARAQPWTATAQARAIAAGVFAGCAIALAFHPAGLPNATAIRFALAAIGLAFATMALVRAWGDRGASARRAARS